MNPEEGNFFGVLFLDFYRRQMFRADAFFMEEYYYSDGTDKAKGPHNAAEIRDLLHEQIIKPSSLIWRPGDPAWQELQSLPEYKEIGVEAPKCDHENTVISKALKEELPAPDETPQAVASSQTAEDKAEVKEEIEEDEVKKITRHQLLRRVRRDLDALWECQREAIISAIKDEELDETYQATRKQNKTIYKEIEGAALNYWRISGLLRKWVGDLTWQDADFSRRLRGKNEFERYADMRQWMESKQVAGYSGCYCFKSAKKYIYVGRATVLQDRFKQYEKSKYFLLGDLTIRIIIPKYKTQIGKMERLLILLHEPEENRNSGDTGKNPVDDCLNFIRNEVKELLTDF
jgi:hypothetical protein